MTRRPKGALWTLDELLAHCLRMEGGCALWTGAETKGYGRAYHGSRWSTAHRLAYVLAYGPIDDDVLVTHTCRRSLCCEPTHLETTTYAEVVRRTRRDFPQNGERNHAAKLTAGDVWKIRILRAHGISQSAVAKRFGVSKSNVSLIENRKRWAHV